MFQTLARTRAGLSISSTGEIERRINGSKAEAPHALELRKYGEDLRVIFLDTNSREFSHDHYHDLEEAFSELSREFGLQRSDWVVLAGA